MLYKTILLELIDSHPELRRRLKAERLHLAAIELYSRELRTMHLELIEQLIRQNPSLDPIQARHSAAEVALDQWQKTHLLDASMEELLAEVKASAHPATPNG
jgi:hypothetical protein